MCKLYERFLKWLCHSSETRSMENEACEQTLECLRYSKTTIDEHHVAFNQTTDGPKHRKSKLGESHSKKNATCNQTTDGLQHSKNAFDERHSKENAADNQTTDGLQHNKNTFDERNSKENAACNQTTYDLQHSMNTFDERHSKENVICNKTLNDLRFSKCAVDERIRIRSVFSEAITQIGHLVFADDIDKILVGSKREGISLFGESDTDVMYVLKNFVVFEDPAVGSQLGRHVFTMDTEGVPTGYTFLRLTDKTEVTTSIAHLLEEYQSAQFLSSKKMMTGNTDKFPYNTLPYEERRGPSRPQRFRHDDEYTTLYDNITGVVDLVNNDIDKVQAIPCECPSILHAWVNRPRPNNWPTTEMVERFSQLPVHVVPVGRSGSVREDVQWRISFTLGEIYLIQQFNDTQIKMLVFMRIIVKNILKPVSRKFSSYLIKNAVLWLSEELPQGSFQAEFLLSRIQDGLQYLLRSIQKKKLPCYTIPERNLLHSLHNDEAARAKRALEGFLADYHRNITNIVTDIGNPSSKLNELSRNDAICTSKYVYIRAEDLVELDLKNSDECYMNANIIDFNIINRKNRLRSDGYKDYIQTVYKEIRS